MADDTHAFIHAIDLTQVDGLGFSIGGMIAHELRLKYSGDARKFIPAGAGLRGGDDMQETKSSVIKALTDAGANPKWAWTFLFFSRSENGEIEVQRFLDCAAERKFDLDPGSSMQIMQVRSQALGEWESAASTPTICRSCRYALSRSSS